MTERAPGLATLSIDAGYKAKLIVCKKWDDVLGLEESDVHSAVRALNLFYRIRRPGFELLDACAPWLSFWPK